MIFFQRNKCKIEQHPSYDRAKGFFHSAKYCTIHFLDHIFNIQRDLSALSIESPHNLFLSRKCLPWTQNANSHFLTLLHFCYVELWSSLDLVIKIMTFKVMSRRSKHLKKKKKKKSLMNDCFVMQSWVEYIYLLQTCQGIFAMMRKGDWKTRAIGHTVNHTYTQYLRNIRISDSQNHS